MVTGCCEAGLYGRRWQQFRRKVKDAAQEAEGLVG